MAIYAQERSFYSKIAFFFIFWPFRVQISKRNIRNDKIDIEEFKIEPIDNNINEDESDLNNKVDNPILVNNIDEEVVANVEENVNVVEGNEVGQENNHFQGLDNLSVAEALTFFSS